MPYENEMRSIAHEMKAEHGAITEIRGGPDNNPIITFADGYILEVPDHSGEVDVSIMTYGYPGTGPDCFHKFLDAAGFEISYEQVTKLREGQVISGRKEPDPETATESKPEEIVASFLATYKNLDREGQESALEALGKIGGALVEPLLDALADDDARLRRPAARALGYIGDARAIEPLSRRLNEIEPDVRSYATTALGQIGDPRAVEPLMDSLTAPRYRSSPEKVINALVQIGEPAIESLTGFIGVERDVLERKVALTALGKIGYTQAVELLVDSLQEESTRVWAAEVLGEIGDTSVVDPLIGLLRDENWQVCQYAAVGLGKTGDSRAVEPLIAILQEGTGSTTEALKALKQLGDNRAVDTVIKILKNPNANIRRAAIEALNEFADPRAAEPLRTLLKDGDKDVRKEAVYALKSLGDAKALKPLIAILEKDEDIWVRCAAVGAIEKLGGSKALEPLIAALENDNYAGTRIDAAKALGRLGDTRAVEPLLAASKKDENVGVRKAAAEALKALG